MRIGVLSDTHNNKDNLKRALEMFRDEGIGTLIHCGDMTTAETAANLTGFRVIYVNGNVDVSADAIHSTLLALNADNFVGDVFTGQLGGTSIAVTHGHLCGKVEELVRSGRYAYVFHGHSHRRRDETIGRTRVINPGALGGLRPQSRSICLLNLDTDDAHFIEIAV